MLHGLGWFHGRDLLLMRSRLLSSIALLCLLTLPLIAQRQQSPQPQEAEQLNRLLSARSNDLLQSLNSPGDNERLLFARRILVNQNRFQLQTPGGREKAAAFLRAVMNRVLSENTGYARALEAAQLLGDPTGEFAERSRLFRTRGLASDTSIFPNFALEEALKSIQSRGLFG